MNYWYVSLSKHQIYIKKMFFLSSILSVPNYIRTERINWQVLIPYAVVTPLRKAASYEPRISILGIWGDTWLTRGKYGIYVAVRGSYGALTGSTWRLLPRKISPIYCRVSYVAVTRIPSLVLRNTWHYVIIRYRYGELKLSYVAHTRWLYAKVWPRHYAHALKPTPVEISWLHKRLFGSFVKSIWAIAGQPVGTETR